MTPPENQPAQSAGAIGQAATVFPALSGSDNVTLAKCDYFVDVQLWPLTARLNPKRWLSNFTPGELPHATQLLNAFLYFNQATMDQLLSAAFQALSQVIHDSRDAYVTTQIEWRQFYDTVLITCVRGERPNATDSGLRFLRMARQILGIPEHRILLPEDVLTSLASGRPCPVVFLDDFVGSGQQFITTWTRNVPLPGHGPVSFEQLASVRRSLQFFYCPLLCTDLGRRNISRDCPTVKLSPAYFIAENYSALATESIIWPLHLRAGARSFIRDTSTRAGISAWEGFYGLALAIAFEHSVPDATLPLFYANANGWKPLIERT